MGLCAYVINDRGIRLKVDLSEEIPFRASYCFSDYRSTNNTAIRSDKVDKIVLRGTKQTNVALEHPYRVNKYSNGVVRNQYRFIIEDGSKPFLGGESILTIEEIIINPKAECVDYDCSVFGSNYTWTSVFSEKSVCELDLGTHSFNDPTIRASWDRFNYLGLGTHNHEDGYVYVPVHYGQWGPSVGGPNEVEFDDLRPSVYIWKIITEAFAQCTDYDISSKWMESEEAQGLIMPFRGSDRDDDDPSTTTDLWTISNDAIRLSNFSAYTNIPITLNEGTDVTLTYAVETSDEGQNYDNGSSVYTVPFTKPYSFTFDLQFSGTLNVAGGINFQVRNKNTLLNLGNIVVNLAAATYTNEVVVASVEDLCLDRDTEVIFVATLFHTTTGVPSTFTTSFNQLGDHNYIVENNRSNTNLCPNAEIDLASTIPCEMTLKDVIDGVTQMYNLKWRTDTENKIVYFEPEIDIFSCKEPQNFSHKVDCDKDINIKFLYEILGNRLEFGYKNDTNDVFIKDGESTDYDRLYGYQRNEKDLYATQVDPNEINNPVFATSWYIEDKEVATDINNPPHWLRMWASSKLDPLVVSNDIYVNESSSYDYCPRIAYYGGLRDYINIVGSAVGFQYEGLNLPYFPHAWVVNYYDPSEYSLSFKDSEILNDVGLVTRFWGDYISSYYRGKLVQMNLILSQADINTLLSEKTFINVDFVGPSIYRLNKIVEYDPVTGRAIVEFITEL